MFKGKKVIIVGERDGVPGPAIATCVQAAGGEIVFMTTECFVWTAAGTMDMESQAQIKKLAEELGKDSLVVVLGASDIEGAEIAAETLTVGDPSFAGPLAGVSLGLPIYHILEPEVRAAIPEDVYEQSAGIVSMIVDTDEVGRKFKTIRETIDGRWRVLTKNVGEQKAWPRAACGARDEILGEEEGSCCLRICALEKNAWIGGDFVKLMKIDMSRGNVTVSPFPEDSLLGGRALIDWYMTESVSPKVHPLAEGNPFIVAPGLLAGTIAPSSGRLSIGGKSPLTRGIKEANVGGVVAHKLGRLRIQGIIVEGRAKDWHVLELNSRGAVLESADDLMGLDNYVACEKLRERYGNEIGILIVGPAGEKLYANSTVAATDQEGRPCRHAARGGVGAVMGAKGLKAIVIDDTGTSMRKAFDEKGFRAAVKRAVEYLRVSPYTEKLQHSGTPVFVNGDQSRGSLQTHNYSRGTFEKVENINASKFAELNRARGGSNGHGCMAGCAVRCSNIFHDRDGNYLTAGLEYETLTLLGSNLGIDDLDAIARMDRKCDGFGMDTIETGAAIGILNDAGLFDFGDSARAEAFIEEIARGTLMGRILGNGTEVTARIFGISRVPTVKGQAIAAHAGRAMKGWGVTYATSPQGADHTAGSVVEDLLSPVGQVERSRRSQILSTALDATGLCHFTFLFWNPDLIAPMVSALYGKVWSAEDYTEMGKQMLRQERAFNLKAGIGPGADALPDWMRTDPLPPTNAVFDVPQEEIEEFFNF